MITVGTVFGITDLKSILGIIILCVQIVWVSLKVIFAIRDHIKEKKTAEIVNDVKEYADDLKMIQNDIDNKDNNDGKRTE